MFGYGQEQLNPDSLKEQLEKVTNDSLKARLLIQIGQQYEANEPLVAADFYRKAGAISRGAEDAQGIISYINNYTYVLNILGKLDSSLMLNLEALKLAEVIGDSQSIGKAYFNAGSSLKLLGRIEEAATFYLKGYDIFERFGNDAILARASDILQMLYHDMDQPHKAILFGKKSIALASQLKDSMLLASASSNLGMSYTDIMEYEKAMECYQLALKVAEKTGNKYVMSGAMMNMADMLSIQGYYEATGPLLTKALSLSREIDDREGEVVALRGVAQFRLYKRQPNEALQYAKQSLAISDSLGLRPQSAKTLQTLSAIYYAMQEIELARKHEGMANKLSDSLNNEALQKNIADLETKYASQAKDRRLNQQQTIIKQRSMLSMALGALALLLMVTLILARRAWRQKQHLQTQQIIKLENEKQLSAAEAVLTGEQNERLRLARELHDGLGGLLSGIKHALQRLKTDSHPNENLHMSFDRALDMLDNSINEMRRIAHNLMPETLLKNGIESALIDFVTAVSESGTLDINCECRGLNDAGLTQSESIAIYRIVQELVNNAMKHARATEVLVQVLSNNQVTSITVEDNGDGFDAKNQQNQNGMGWLNIKNRVAYHKGQIDIQSSINEGTSVFIEWPRQDLLYA